MPEVFQRRIEGFAVADVKRLRSKAMTTARIKEIRDRWAKVTPGEWKCVVDERRSGCGCGTKADPDLLDGTVSIGVGHSPDCITTKLPDALAIASAPDDIRWLCEQVERLEKVVVWMNNLLAGREWNETEKVE